MKTATIPALRVEPEFRDEIESILHKGESLSGFMASSLKQAVHFRKSREAFIEKGLLAEKEAKTTGVYFSSDEVLAELEQMLLKAESEQL
ncbi:Prevent host death protein, Phd antitoxin |nr:Prevent host death protein, Phd antitoxin \